MDQLAFAPTDLQQLAHIAVRLLVALLGGGIIGLQRELTHKTAGLRTHMLVALGTSLFLVAATEAGFHADAVSRIVQGLATGIGFLGGGAILKLTAEHEIHGLTTAAGIWMTAAAGAAAGLGQIGVAIIGVVLALMVLAVFARLERHLGHQARKDAEDHHHLPPSDGKA